MSDDSTRDGAPERELLDGAAIPTTTLSGESERHYIDRLLAVLSAARLNRRYPDARAMRSHIRALHPEIHRGLYDGVEMNLDSGLPSYKAWTRVQTDVRIAADQLRQLGPREALAERVDQTTDGSSSARARDPGIHAEQLRKHDYYSDIRDTDLVPLGDMTVKLRRIDTDNETAYFHVILDKLDASGLFVRFSIDLAQQNSVWSENVVELDDETARHTEEFQSLIYKFTSLDAEFTYAKLAGLGGLDISSVTKGTVGPIYFAPEQAPEELRPLFSGDSSDGSDTSGPAAGATDVIATFSLDRVAEDVTEHRDNDPLDSTFVDQLGDDARQVYQKARQHYDYRTFRDRKFVVPQHRVDALREWCRDRDTKNIIYSLR